MMGLHPCRRDGRGPLGERATPASGDSGLHAARKASRVSAAPPPLREERRVAACSPLLSH
jgi:hypothetical protein